MLKLLFFLVALFALSLPAHAAGFYFHPNSGVIPGGVSTAEVLVYSSWVRLPRREGLDPAFGSDLVTIDGVVGGDCFVRLNGDDVHVYRHESFDASSLWPSRPTAGVAASRVDLGSDGVMVQIGASSISSGIVGPVTVPPCVGVSEFMLGELRAVFLRVWGCACWAWLVWSLRVH